MYWEHPESHPGEFLEERYLRPLGITADELAEAIQVPLPHVEEVLSGARRISPEMARRLAIYLRMDPLFWIELQGRWDLAFAEEPEIEPADTQGFLVGPKGATPLPRPTGMSTAEALAVGAAAGVAAVGVVAVGAALLARLQAKAKHTPEPEEEREQVLVEYPDGQKAWVSKAR